MGAIVIQNADNGNEVFESIGMLVETVADTMESTGVGNRLLKRTTASKRLFKPSSLVKQHNSVQNNAMYFGDLVSSEMSVDLDNIKRWSSEEVDAVDNIKRLSIRHDQGSMDAIVKDGVVYVEQKNSVWFELEINYQDESVATSHTEVERIPSSAAKDDAVTISRINVEYTSAKSRLRNFINNHYEGEVKFLNSKPDGADFEPIPSVWIEKDAPYAIEMFMPGADSVLKVSNFDDVGEKLKEYAKNRFEFNARWFLSENISVVNETSDATGRKNYIRINESGSNEIVFYRTEDSEPELFESFEELRYVLFHEGIIDRVKVNRLALSSTEIIKLEENFNVDVTPLMLNGKQIAVLIQKKDQALGVVDIVAHGAGAESLSFLKPEGVELNFLTPDNTKLTTLNGFMGEHAEFLDRLKFNRINFSHESQIYPVMEMHVKDYDLDGSGLPEFNGFNDIARYVGSQKIEENASIGPISVVSINPFALGIRLSDIISVLKHTFGETAPSRVLCHFCRHQEDEAPFFDIKYNFAEQDGYERSRGGSYGRNQKIEKIIGDENDSRLATNQIAGQRALERQKTILGAAEINITPEESAHLQLYSYDSNLAVNRYLRYGQNNVIPTGFSSEFEFGTASDRVARLAEIINRLPQSQAAILYRGGNAARGTSGAPFRVGSLKAGDILVNSDFLSFTENPRVIRDFAGGKPGASGRELDNTSVIFEVKQSEKAKIFAPFSWRNSAGEAESVYVPDNAFEVVSVRSTTVTLDQKKQPLMVVELRETALPEPVVSNDSASSVITLGNNTFDFRTGERFDWGLFTVRYPLADEQ